MSQPAGLPTPVFRADAGVWRTRVASTHGIPGDSELWIKTEGRSHERYGGNKIRKLGHIIDEATQRGARRIVTFGAAGSHHVLATTLLASERGISVAAVLFPQPYSPHAEQTLRAALALGLEAHPARSLAAAPLVAASVVGRRDLLVPPGGSNVTGTLGWIDAANELDEQIRAGTLPEPDVVVVPLGSGGTAAGLLAGLVARGRASRVAAVRVVPSRIAGRALVVSLAARAARRAGLRVSAAALSDALEIDARFLGRGYGWPTIEGEHASDVARPLGLELDATYTQKTFAAALARVGVGPRAASKPLPLRVLYWHTLSALPLEPLMGEWKERALPAQLARLLVG